MAVPLDRSACSTQNIISNAIKYRKPGQAPKIDITAAAMGEKTIRLTIVDFGVGFKEEFVQTIFEPFKRLHDKVEYPGTGIELAICKSIADRHGWDISVKSHPGEGTSFSFMIPTLSRMTPRHARRRSTDQDRRRHLQGDDFLSKRLTKA